MLRRGMPERTSYDAVIVGGGHNGLVAAAYLARAGRSVLVLERLDHTGGAAVSTRAFAGVDARLSRYSYLVSLLPPKIVRDLGLNFAVRKRTVSSYTPAVRDGRPTGLLVGGGQDRTRAAFAELTGSDREFAAWERFYGSTRRLAERVFPTLTEPLPTRAALRARIDDDALWEALFERPLGEAVEEAFTDDLVRGVVLTDALIGTFAAAHDPSLRQNRCFLYHVIGGGTGDWDVPIGGMGALTDALAGAARRAGAEIVTDCAVTGIATDGRTAEVTCEQGTFGARRVLVNAAPRELARLLGEEPPPAAEGAQLKVNMLLTRLPRLRDTRVDPREAFSGTFHVAEGYGQLETAYQQAAAGELPAAPPSEIYCHSLTDPSILGADLVRQGWQTLTLFGLHTPASLFAADTATTPPASGCWPPPSGSWTPTSPSRSPTAWPTTPTAGRASRRAARWIWTGSWGCRAATSSTASWPSRTRSPTERRTRRRPRRAAGAWRPRTPTCCCAVRARCAAGE